jgi:hypothetical protein
MMGQPEQCAKVIGHALTTARPRARYLVGLDAQALALTDRLVPTIVKDRAMRIVWGL